MKTASAPFASSGWSTSQGELKNVKSWDEIKYGRQPLILKKNVNGIEIYTPCNGSAIRKSEQVKPVSLKAATAERTVLYPVKKMVCQQNLKYSPTLGTNLYKGSGSYESRLPRKSSRANLPQTCRGEIAVTVINPDESQIITLADFRIKQYTTRPLTLARPLGNVINLQAPDGSRAGTPLLEHSPNSSEWSSPSSHPTCSSWDGSDHDTTVNYPAHYHVVTSSSQTSDNQAVSQFVDQSIPEGNTTVHVNECEKTVVEQFVLPEVSTQNSSTVSSFDTQRDFMVTYHDLLGSPVRLPEHLSPNTERYLLDLDKQNLVSQGGSCGPETLQAACNSQVSDIDYSLFDEFFVRT